MHANLRMSLAAAVLVAGVPVAGVASAHEGQSKGKDRAEKPAQRCHHGGRGYEARGTLADGSTLTQVAGADTARRNDDRFSGTLVVQVKHGNRRGREDKGLTTFALTNVRALGTVQGAAPLPAIGTRIDLVGRLPKSCATPSPTPPPVASAARVDDAQAPTTSTDPGSDGPSGSDYPAATTPAAATSAAVIRLVVFKVKRERPARGRDDSQDASSTDDESRESKSGGDDDAFDDLD
jgi:hypothetical protein